MLMHHYPRLLFKRFFFLDCYGFGYSAKRNCNKVCIGANATIKRR